MLKIPPVCGRVILGMAIVLAVPVGANAASKEKVIYSFAAGADGATTQGGVILDALGNLYGTTQGGAGSGCGGGGCGTVFKLTPKGKETILHVFTGDDGAFPVPGLVADVAGNLYGTAINGGPRSHPAGTVFKVTPDGQFSVVHVFKGGAGGAHPVAGLIIDKKGNLYGTTASGGNDCNGTGGGCGTVFKIKPDGKYKVLYAFNGTDGISPVAGLMRDESGNLYGTTANGGTDCDGSGQGCGTVFKLTPGGTQTVLYAFEGGDHGAYPAAGVIMDDAGTIYGTTNNGGIDCDGAGAGCGTVFKLTSEGTETGLHTFAGGDDGAYPKDALLMDGAGHMYGTTVEGGSENDGGVVFEITPTGKEKIVYAFTGGDDGGGPFAGLIMDGTGGFYGTTFTGGVNFFGTVFKLKP